MSTERRAIGLIRVSRVRGREGESFASPNEQRERIQQACAREGLHLIGDHEELDVSGGAPLDRRDGLSAAIEAIEAGRADTLVAAYFDRLFRSVRVQADVLERIERAGGHVLAVDVGVVGEGTAAEWLSAGMHGLMAEYFKRQIGEKSSAAQRRAIERGVPPLANIPPGYRRGEDGRLEVEPREAPIVAQAFKMRAAGASIKEVRAYMQANGVERTWRSTQTTLASPIVLGEIHFGKMVNLEAHPAIVDRETFREVQKMRVPRGRKAKSERLLARLGVLRCGTCGGLMSVGSRNKPIKSTGEQGRYPMYKCSPTSDCRRRVAISAERAEREIVQHVRELLADRKGHASALERARNAEHRLSTAKEALEAAVRAFDGLVDVEASTERLQELNAAVAAAQADVDQIGPTDIGKIVHGAKEWDKLAIQGKRELIRALVPSATVAPGRGADRITIA